MAQDTIKQVGSKRYIRQMTPEQNQQFLNLVPNFAKAIKVAENNPKNFGVLSTQVNTPQQAGNILNNSVYNNLARWNLLKQPGKFIDFMQQRWAPIGAKNDPKNLNKNWSKNVRASLLKSLGKEKYQEYKKLNLVMNKHPEIGEGIEDAIQV